MTQTENRFDVLIFCAGAGTRTYPYTKSTPKALLPLSDGTFPLLLICRELSLVGIKHVIASYSYGREMFQEAAKQIYDKYGITVKLSPEEEPTGHGGGLRSARHLLTHEKIFAINGDTILSTEGGWVSQLINECSPRVPFTILGTYRNEGRLKVDDSMHLVGLKDRLFQFVDLVKDCDALGAYAFHVSALSYIPPSGFFGLFGTDDLAENLIRSGKECHVFIPPIKPQRIEISDKLTYEDLIKNKYRWIAK